MLQKAATRSHRNCKKLSPLLALRANGILLPLRNETNSNLAITICDPLAVSLLAGHCIGCPSLFVRHGIGAEVHDANKDVACACSRTWKQSSGQVEGARNRSCDCPRHSDGRMHRGSVSLRAWQ